MSNFDQAFHDLIGNEGGYSNDPNDPGGETMWGITKRVALEEGYTGEMRDLPLDTARAIARKRYWDPYHCDSFDPHVSFQILDTAYNGGHVVQWLQKACEITQDGVLGPATIAAIQSMNPYKLVMRFDAFRLQYMTSLHIWPSFGRGWANRIAENLLLATD
jgi:lysozyme family protein